MKKTFVTSISCAILLLCILGCGLVDRVQKSVTGSENTNSNKTLADKGVDTVVGEEKIGVAECDEVVDMLTAEMNNPEDNFVVKAGKAMVLNKIKQSIKESVEKNKNDKVEMAKNCKEFKKELDKYKVDEQKKTQ